MTLPFPTVREVGYEPPPGCEDWLFVASFAPLLPDRYNVWFLFKQTHLAFPDQCLMLPDEPELDVVVSVEFIIAPDEAVAAFVQEKLALIEQGDILEPEPFWELVNPIIQKLWEGEAVAGRSALCREAGLADDLALTPHVPAEIHSLLYRQISI